MKSQPQQMPFRCTQCGRGFVQNGHFWGRITSIHNRMLSTIFHSQQQVYSMYDDLPDAGGTDVNSTHISEQRTSSVCEDFLRFYEAYGDRTIPLCNKSQKLPIPFEGLPVHVLLYIKFCLRMSFTEEQAELYYEHIFR